MNASARPRAPRLSWLAIGLLAIVASIPAALAQAPAPYSPRTTPMTFRIVSGEGPGGASRWIEAAGQLRIETAKEFEAFRKEHNLQDLTMVLDSNGGSIGSAMTIGRAMRALGIRTTIGRTVDTDQGKAVRSRDVLCGSACVLLLAAGKERQVPGDAQVGLHMFGLSVNASGHRTREGVELRDFEDAQRIMASHAVYLHEMGVHPRLLTLMTEASFRSPLRLLSQPEIRQTQLASITEPLLPRINPVGRWSLSSPAAPPQLQRTRLLSAQNDRTIAHELVLDCDGVRGFYWTTYRVLVTGTGQPPLQASIRLARIETGGWDFLFRPPDRPLIANASAAAWMRRSVPQKVFADAIANRRMLVSVTDAQGRAQQQDFYDADFDRIFAELGKRCEALPNRVTMGGNPRR